MGIFGNSNYAEIDEKKYKQILAEEELEEKYFNRDNSFKKMDEKVERKMKEQEEKDIEEYVDETDYDEYSNDYSNFNLIKEDYEEEEDVYIDEDEIKEAEEKTSYSLDKSDLVDIINSLYKWFAIFAAVLAGLLIIYLLIKAKFIAIFLYILGLVCSFLFGYILMFIVNTFFFKN